MERRLIEPMERWLLDWPFAALLLALLWRIGAGALLWGQGRNLTHGLGLIDSQLIALMLLAGLLGLARVLVPRDYSAAVALFIGGSAWLAALSMLPRHGWLVHWPLEPLSRAWYVLAVVVMLLALVANAYLHLHWRRQLRGHGVEWTKRWAWSRPYAARKLALKALRYMGDWELG
jgi:hypothetical protein